MTSIDGVDTTLFNRAYADFVDLLQERGFELSASRLGPGGWIVYVVPRALLTIRTRYDGHAQTLSVHIRRVVGYVERYSVRIADVSMDAALAEAVALHERLARPPQEPPRRGNGERR